MAKKIIISSGSGGVGKTTFALNFSSEISDKSVKTIIIDLNYGKRDTDLYLNFQNKIIYDLGDVLKGIVSLKDAIVNVNNTGLYYLPAPMNVSKLIKNLKEFNEMIDRLDKIFSLIVFDISIESLLNIGKLLKGADYGFCLLENNIISLRNTEVLLELYKKLGIKYTFSVINKYKKINARGLRNILSLDFVNTKLNILTYKFLGSINYSENFHRASLEGFLPVKKDEEVLKEYLFVIKNFLDNIN